jgi:hypothetical protein
VHPNAFGMQNMPTEFVEIEIVKNSAEKKGKEKHE